VIHAPNGAVLAAMALKAHLRLRLSGLGERPGRLMEQQLAIWIA